MGHTSPLSRRSGLILRLVVERYVSLVWTRHRVRDLQSTSTYMQFKVAAPGASFHRRNETVNNGSATLQFQSQFAAFTSNSQIQTFDFNDLHPSKFIGNRALNRHLK